MKYMLMMHAKKSGFEEYMRWSKEDIRAQVAFMRAFSKELKDAGVFRLKGSRFPIRPRPFALEVTAS
jgi:hypothetical protein